MEFFVVFKYLHVASMFFAVALAVSTELVMQRVASTGDAQTIRNVVPRVRPLGNLSTGFFLAGVAFGVVAALTGQMNLLAPWLLLSYAAFVSAVLIGMLVTEPWTVRLETAAAEGRSPEHLRTVIADPAARAGTGALMALVAILVFLMVVKPFA
jgi:hypothetical protein